MNIDELHEKIHNPVCSTCERPVDREKEVHTSVTIHRYTPTSTEVLDVDYYHQECPK